MIGESLEFLRSQLDGHVKTLGGNATASAKLSPIFDADGKNILKDALLGLSLINVEEERVNRAQQREVVNSGGALSFMAPEVRLNLHVLVAANIDAKGDKYDQSLKSLSAAISFFQSHRVFESDSYSDLPKGVEKLVVELETLDYEFQNHVWGTLGGKLLPSVMYRIRLVTIQEGHVTGTGKAIRIRDEVRPA